MIKFVFFDLDDTIFDFHKAEHIAIKRTLESFNIPADEKYLSLYSEINNEQWKKLERKEITREELKIIRFRIFLDRIGFQKIDAIVVGKSYENFLSIGHYYIDNALEVVKELSKNYRLFLVSNGLKKVQRGRLSDSEVKNYFENIFISEEIGANKPEKEYFEKCFSKIDNFEREKAVIIGDSLSSDILGGNNVKIKTIWFNRKNIENNSSIKPSFEIKSLDELSVLLKNI